MQVREPIFAKLTSIIRTSLADTHIHATTLIGLKTRMICRQESEGTVWLHADFPSISGGWNFPFWGNSFPDTGRQKHCMSTTTEKKVLLQTTTTTTPPRDVCQEWLELRENAREIWRTCIGIVSPCGRSSVVRSTVWRWNVDERTYDAQRRISTDVYMHARVVAGIQTCAPARDPTRQQ